MSIMAPSNITDRLEPNSKWIKRLPNKAIRILPKMVINTSELSMRLIVQYRRLILSL